MTEVITKDAIDNFKAVTLYDVGAFFKKYIDFIDVDYANIVNYFSGFSSVSPTTSFGNLAYLTREYKKIIDVVIQNSASLDNYVYWALVEYVEDIGSALETANNASKWLRSALTKNGYKQQVITSLMTSQNQGLEGLERDQLKSNDPDGWVETALENQLREEDYTLDGGALIQVIYKNNASLSINGIVDNIDSANKTYGLDIDQNIGFSNDDLNVLSYKDTMLQSAAILGNLKKGDDPAFPNRGIDVKSIVGQNAKLASLAYPIVFRQLAANFATDDSFKSFKITDVKKDNTEAKFEYTVSTRAGEVFDNFILI